MKKRVYSLILILACVFSYFVMPVSAARVKITETEAKAALLEAIGVTEEIKLQGTLTNIQLAGYLLKFFNIECSEEEIVQHALSCGILDKNDNPEAELDYNMLCKMTVSAMGYGADVKKNGGYPNGYINAATGHNFFKNTVIDKTKPITGEIVVNVLCNLLKLDMYTKMFAGGLRIEKTTPLEVMGISEHDGIVTAVKGQTMMGEEAHFDNRIGINSTEYVCDIKGLNNYFGKKVVYYYDEEEEKILYISEDKNSTLIIDASMIVEKEVSDGVYKVTYQDLREKKYKFKAEPKYVSLNGEVVTGAAALSAILDFDYGQVILVDYDNDEVYDIMMAEEYENYFVKFHGTDVIYDRFTANEIVFDFEETDNNYTFIKNGVPVSYDDIIENSVISVYKDTLGKNIKVYISENKISGKLESFSTDEEGKTKLIIDGFPYYTTIDLSNISLGDTTTFYLDINGNIAGYDATNIVRALDYGYLVKLYSDDDTDAVAVKIFTKNEGMIHLYAKDEAVKVTHKGKIGKYTMDGLKRNFGNGHLFNTDGTFIPQLVQFASNGNYLTKLVISPKKTDYNESGSYFQQADSSEESQYGRDKLGRFAIDTADGGTWVLAVPNAERAGYDKGYISGYTLASKSKYTCKFYDVDEFLTAKVVVVEIASADRVVSTSAIDRGINLSVVESIKLKEFYDEEEEEVDKIWEVKIGHKGSVQTYTIKYQKNGLYLGEMNKSTGDVVLEVASNGERILIDTDVDPESPEMFLHPGDVGQINVVDGNIVAFRRWYDHDKKWMPCAHSGGSPVPGFSITSFGGEIVEGTYGYGEVTNISSKVIIIDTTNTEVPETYRHKPSMGKAVYPATYQDMEGYIYDTADKAVYPATLRDIRIGDKIVFGYVYFNFDSFVVIR